MLKYKGHQLGLPKYCGTSAFYGNTNLFQQSGVTFPGDTTTWDTFRSNLISLTKSQGGTTTQFGLDNGLANIGYVLSWMVWSWGGEVVDPKDNSKCLLDQPPALDALQYVQDSHLDAAHRPAADRSHRVRQGCLRQRQVRHGREWLRVAARPTPESSPDGTGLLSQSPRTHGDDSQLSHHRLLCHVERQSEQEHRRRLATAALRHRTNLGAYADRAGADGNRRASPWPKNGWRACDRSAPTLQSANLEAFLTALTQARPQLRFSNGPKALAILNPVIDAVYNKNTTPARTAFTQAAPQVTAALKAASTS